MCIPEGADHCESAPLTAVCFVPVNVCTQRIKLRTQPAQWVARAAQLAAEKAQNVKDMQAARLRVAGAVSYCCEGGLILSRQWNSGMH